MRTKATGFIRDINKEEKSFVLQSTDKTVSIWSMPCRYDGLLAGDVVRAFEKNLEVQVIGTIESQPSIYLAAERLYFK